MSQSITAGSTVRALFVPRAFASGVPIALSNVSAELVRASDFSVVADTGGSLVMTTSGTPHHEYLVGGEVPTDAQPGEVYFFRFAGEADGTTYRAVATVRVGADLSASLQAVLALSAVSGCCR